MHECLRLAHTSGAKDRLQFFLKASILIPKSSYDWKSKHTCVADSGSLWMVRKEVEGDAADKGEWTPEVYEERVGEREVDFVFEGRRRGAGPFVSLSAKN